GPHRGGEGGGEEPGAAGRPVGRCPGEGRVVPRAKTRAKAKGAGSEQAFDVIIAGAGMTGATLALALGRAGLKVAAVESLPLEARVDPESVGRASAVAYGVFREWRALGIGEALEAVAQPMRSILVTDGPRPGAGSGAPMPVFLRYSA